MTEAQLQAAVLQLCKLYGLAAYHPWISVRSERGWPDLTIAGRSLLFRELKSDAGKTTVSQLEWGVRLGDAGQDWDVWRPADLHSGRIQRELEAIR